MNCQIVLNPDTDRLQWQASIEDICANTYRGFRVSIVGLPLFIPDTPYERNVGLNGRNVDGFPCRSVAVRVNDREDPIVVQEVELTLPLDHDGTATFPLRCFVLRAWCSPNKLGSGWVLRASVDAAIHESWRNFIIPRQRTA